MHFGARRDRVGKGLSLTLAVQCWEVKGSGLGVQGSGLMCKTPVIAEFMGDNRCTEMLNDSLVLCREFVMGNLPIPRCSSNPCLQILLLASLGFTEQRAPLIPDPGLGAPSSLWPWLLQPGLRKG